MYALAHSLSLPFSHSLPSLLLLSPFRLHPHVQLHAAVSMPESVSLSVFAPSVSNPQNALIIIGWANALHHTNVFIKCSTKMLKFMFVFGLFQRFFFCTQPVWFHSNYVRLQIKTHCNAIEIANLRQRDRERRGEHEKWYTKPANASTKKKTATYKEHNFSLMIGLW